MNALKSNWHWLLLVTVVGLILLGTPAPQRPATIAQIIAEFVLVLVLLAVADLAASARKSHCAVCHRPWAVFRGPRRAFSERRCSRHRIPLAERRATSRRMRGVRL